MPQGTILLVDDEELIVKQFRRTLNRAGYTVDTAYSGEAGWEQYQKRYYDVVLVDWKMGKMSGMDLLAHIDNMHPNTKVIMITAFRDNETAIEAHHHHAFDFLTKPVKSEVLLEKVAEAMRRKDGIVMALEEWVITHPEKAARPHKATLGESGEKQFWSAKAILDEVKANTERGRHEYQKLIQLTIDLLTRGKIK